MQFEKKWINTFNISWICNLKCIYCCWYPKEIDIKALKNNIKWLNEITLQWWEPLLSKELFEIIEFAKDNWTQKINIITNWILLSSNTFAQKLVWEWINEYQIAFPTHIAKLADMIWQSKNVLRNKISWIINLINLWEVEKIRLVHLIQKDNIDNILEFVLFVKKYFWNQIKIEFKFIQYFDNDTNIWNMPYYSDISEKMNKAFALCKKLWISYIINWIPLCFIKDIFHSNCASYNNSNNTEEMEAYATKKLSKCNDCKYTKNCIWVRDDYLMLKWQNEFN